MSKLVLSDVTNINSITTINANFEKIQEELQEKVLYRDNPDVEPNHMDNNLDMNGNKIINAGEVRVGSLVINGVPVEPGTGVTTASAFQVYEYTATEGQTAFSVAPHTPFVSSLQVEVNGLSYPPSGYDVSGTNVIIPSASAGDEVVIRRFVNAPTTIPTAEDITFIQNGVGALPRTMQDKGREIVSVKDFGAVGDGIADDTAAINAALAAVNVQAQDWIDVNKNYLKNGGPTLYFPPGDYVYSGTGLTAPYGYVNIVGAGRDCTRLKITQNVYLCSFTSAMFGRITGMHIYGGKGAYVVTTTGTNTEGYFDFTDNYFFNFTECGIGCDSSDSPNWRIKGNIFFGAIASGERTAIGVALGGKCDESVIEENAFQNCRHDIKLDVGSTCVKISRNGHFKWTGTSPGGQIESAIWLVPTSSAPTLDNTGIGVNIINNKFGSENLLASTHRILIAEESGTGSRHTKAVPSLSASTKFIGGLRVKDNTVFSVPGGKGLIYSTTPHLWGCDVDNTFNGTPIPSIEYLAGIGTNSNAVQDTTNIVKALHVGGSSYVLPYPIGPIGGGLVEDPLSLYQGHPSVRSHWQSGHDPQALSEFTTQRVTAFSSGAATYAQTMDAIGGNEAIEVTCTGSGGYVSTSLGASFTPGLAAWVEMDIAVGSSLPLTWVRITLTDVTGASNAILERRVQLPSGWRRVVFPVMSLSNAVAVQNLTIACESSDYSAGVRTKFKVGRVRCYHAAAPVNPGVKHLDSGLVSWNPGSIGSNSEATTTITVGGARPGDLVTWSYDANLNGVRQLQAYVSSNDTVTVVLRNFTAGSLTPSVGNVRVRVFKGV